MIKKFSARLGVSEPALALVQLAHTLSEHDLPASLEAVRAPVEAASSRVIQQAGEILDLAAGLKRKRGIKLRSEAFPSGAGTPLRHHHLEVELPALFSDAEAEKNARGLFLLLSTARQAGWFEIDGRAGREHVERLEPLLDALTEAASKASIFLDPSRQPDVRFDDEPSPAASPPPPPSRGAAKSPSPGGAAPKGPAPGGKGAEGGEPPGKGQAKPGKGAGKGKKASGGSFGGLPDDAEAPPKAPGALTEEELFFLSYASQPWPCSEAEIKAAYRRVIKMAHPDKHVDDPAAHHRFLLLKKGYEGMVRRIHQKNLSVS